MYFLNLFHKFRPHVNHTWGLLQKFLESVLRRFLALLLAPNKVYQVCSDAIDENPREKRCKKGSKKGEQRRILDE